MTSATSSSSSTTNSTSTSTTPFTTRPFSPHRMPVDILNLISSHLDARSLIHLSCCDSFILSVTQRATLWYNQLLALIIRPWQKYTWLRSSNEFHHTLTQIQLQSHLPSLKSSFYSTSRMKYLELVKMILVARTVEVEKRKKAQHGQSLQKYSFICRWYDEVVLPILGGIILLFTFFRFLRTITLREEGEVNAEWTLVEPVITLGILFGISAVTLILSVLNRPTLPHEDDATVPRRWILLPASHFYRSCSFFRTLQRSLSIDHLHSVPRRKVVVTQTCFWLTIACYYAWILALALRITGHIEWSWSRVWLPFYPALFLSMILNSLHNLTTNRSIWNNFFKDFVIALLLWLFPVNLFFILLHLHLEYSTTFSLLIPLSSLCIIDLYTLLTLFAILCDFARSGSGSTLVKIGKLILVAGAWCVVDVPLIMVKWNFARYMGQSIDTPTEEKISLRWVFLPLFVLMSFLVFGGFITALRGYAQLSKQWKSQKQEMEGMRLDAKDLKLREIF